MTLLRIAILAFSVVLTALASLVPAHAQQGGRRVAFVVGNDGYSQIARLERARADARLMAATLRDIGFDVQLKTDLGNREFSQVAAEFIKGIGPGDTVFVFFAGHGIARAGVNYLLPVDISTADAANDLLLRDNSASEARLLADIAERRPETVVVVIDACRDDPFARGTRSVGTRGLARVEPPARVFLIRSASAGEAALDRLPRGPDSSPNSVFTRMFAPALKRPGARLTDVITEVRREVFALAESVGHQQFPDYQDRSLTPIVLVAGAVPSAAPVPAASQPQATPVAAAPATPAQPAAPVAAPPAPQVASVAQPATGGARRSFLPTEPVPIGLPHEGVKVFRECEGCPVIVLGSEEPFRKAMGRTEVTFEEWDLCVAAKACRPVDDLGQGRGNRPVSLVSFEDAETYIRWLNIRVGLAGSDGKPRSELNRYRLPTFSDWWSVALGWKHLHSRPAEAEAFGEGRKAISPEMANYNWSLSFNGSPRGVALKQALPAGSFPPGAYGHFDLIGNLREWTLSCPEDFNQSWPTGRDTDHYMTFESQRNCKARLVVGGSFDDHPRDLQVNAHDPQTRRMLINARTEDAGARNLRTGFRVLRDFDY